VINDIGPFKCSELPPIGYDEVLCGAVGPDHESWFVGIPLKWERSKSLGDCIRFVIPQYESDNETVPCRGISISCNYWMSLPEVSE
jgi:hypothetical protein